MHGTSPHITVLHPNIQEASDYYAVEDRFYPLNDPQGHHILMPCSHCLATRYANALW